MRTLSRNELVAALARALESDVLDTLALLQDAIESAAEARASIDDTDGEVALQAASVALGEAVKVVEADMPPRESAAPGCTCGIHGAALGVPHVCSRSADMAELRAAARAERQLVSYYRGKAGHRR